MSLVTLTNAAVSRGGAILLSGLDLKVVPGDIVWLRGPNGSGKSTLLRAIAGFLPLSEGRREVTDSLAYLGHRNGFEPRAKLTTEAGFWLDDSDGLAEWIGIPTIRNRRIFELSAGQMRRFELYRLQHDARQLWLLDEPFASLDSHTRESLTDMIRSHTETGGAAIIVSHGDLPAFGRDVKVLTIGEVS